MPLEKYLPGEEKPGLRGKKSADNILQNIPKEAKRDDLKRSLEAFRENYKKRRAEAIKEGRERGKREFLEQQEGTEQVAEKKEINAGHEYGKIWEYRGNYLSYRREGGWKQRYLEDKDPVDGLPVKDKISIEEYVYNKQLERLEDIRDGLLIQRVNNHFDILFPDLKENEYEIKQQKTQQDCRDYFKSNRAEIDKYFTLKSDVKVSAKEKLQSQFLSFTMSGSDLSKPEILKEAGLLFEELLTDYEQMHDSIYQLNVLNPKMVELMSNDNMTEDEWLQLLAEEAEEELEEMKKAEQKATEQRVFQSLGQPVSYDLTNVMYSGEISATEKLAPDTRISISMVKPGEYKIRFPGSEDTIMESSFLARRVVNEKTGISETIYLFKDPLLDTLQRVGEAQFKQMVNGVYLEHVMSDSVKAGADYIGPSLNDEVLPDSRMLKLAELLFYPKKLAEKSLTTEQAEVFRKLMLVLVSKSNNQKGTGDYGDLLATGSRVGLLELALTMDGASRAQMCYNYLMTSPMDNIRSLSIEELCYQIGVPKNSGNYKKT